MDQALMMYNMCDTKPSLDESFEYIRTKVRGDYRLFSLISRALQGHYPRFNYFPGKMRNRSNNQVTHGKFLCAEQHRDIASIHQERFSSLRISGTCFLSLLK